VKACGECTVPLSFPPSASPCHFLPISSFFFFSRPEVGMRFPFFYSGLSFAVPWCSYRHFLQPPFFYAMTLERFPRGDVLRPTDRFQRPRALALACLYSVLRLGFPWLCPAFLSSSRFFRSRSDSHSFSCCFLFSQTHLLFQTIPHRSFPSVRGNENFEESLFPISSVLLSLIDINLRES